MERHILTNSRWHIFWLSAYFQHWLFTGHLIGCSVMGLSSILIEAALILECVKGPITLHDISPHFSFLFFWMAPCVLYFVKVISSSMNKIKLVLVTQCCLAQHSSSSFCPKSFMLPTPKQPMQVDQLFCAASPPALKSPSRKILSVCGNTPMSESSWL